MPEESPYTYYRPSVSARQRTVRRDGATAQDYVRAARPPVAVQNGTPVYNPTPREVADLGLGYVFEPGSSVQPSNLPEPTLVPQMPSFDPDAYARFQKEAVDRAIRMASPADGDPLYHPDRRTQEFKRQQQASYTGELLNQKLNDPKYQYGNFVDDMFGVMEDIIAARDQAFADGQAELAAQYQKQINELAGQIAKAQQGKNDANEAFAKYRDTVDPLFDEHLGPTEAAEAAQARIEARADETLAETNEAQEEATSAFDDLLVRIGADNIELAASLHAEATALDEMGEDFILGEGSSAVAIASAQAELVDRTIASIRSDDEFFTEAARQQLEDQFNNRIEALKERQAQVAAEKRDALAKYAKDFEKTYGAMPFGNPDEVWEFMAGSWAEREGWDFQHAMDVNGEVDKFWKSGIRTAEEYKAAAQQSIFEDNVEVFMMQNGLGEDDWPALQAKIEENPNLKRVLMGELALNYGPSIDPTFVYDGLEQYDEANRDAANMLDLRSRMVQDYSRLSREVDAFGTLEADPVTGWVSPVGPAGEYSNSFGYQKPESKGGHIHKGIDIYAPKGSYIYAPEGGEVIAVGIGDVSGYHIKVRSDTGVIYYFAHMDDMSWLKKGDRVRAGASIGTVGNSGNARGTSPHAHFEMRKGDQWINPYTWLEAARNGGGTVSSTGYSFSSASSAAATSSSSPRPGLT